MSRKAFKRIVAGLQDAVAYAAGEPGHGRLRKPMTPEERPAQTPEQKTLQDRYLAAMAGAGKSLSPEHVSGRCSPLECYLKPLAMTRHAFAARLGMSTRQLRGLVDGTRAVTAETAILLGRALKTSPDFWMNAQVATDLYKARKSLARKRARSTAS